MRRDRERPIIIVKKTIKKGGHHGGAWKVAFADFMTSMMALFLVLWIVGQSSDIKSAIAGYFSDPLGHASEFGSSFTPGMGSQATTVRIMSQKQVMDMRRARLEFLADRIREQVDQTVDLRQLEDYVEVQFVDDGLRVELLENADGVFFELGSAMPSGPGQALLSFLGSEFAGYPNPIIIEGHTDARPFRGRPDYSNWELSTDRANSARRLLVESGLPVTQILQVRGHADRQLRDQQDPFAPSNRRVSVTMLLDYNLASDPGTG